MAKTRNNKLSNIIGINEALLQGLRPSLSTLPSLFRMNPIMVREPIFCLIDPFYAFVTSANLMQFIGQIEVSKFSSADNNLMRQSLINYPGLQSNIIRPNIEDQVITSKMNASKIQDATRERSQFQVALTPIFWIVSWSLAYAPEEWRSEYTARAITAGITPAFTSECFKRVRRSQSGIFDIIPVIFNTANSVFLHYNPQFTNTFLDLSFLYTPGGIQRFVEFTVFLSGLQGNYIPMVEASNKSLPIMQAHFTTRFNAIGIVLNETPVYASDKQDIINMTTSTPKASTVWLNSKQYLLTGHSYGNIVDSVHMADALVLQQVHSTDRNPLGFISDSSYQSFCTSNKFSEINATTQALAQHVFMRVIQELHNPTTPPGTAATPAADGTPVKPGKPAKPQATKPDEFVKLILPMLGVSEQQLRLILDFVSKLVRIINNKSQYRKLTTMLAALPS